MSYSVNVPKQANRDIDEAVFYKTELGTYPENIKAFVLELDKILYDELSESPKVGSNLSSRIGKETKIKYQVIEDYLLFYEITNDEVDVLRLLPGKSNWMNTILKKI